jgi:hypothetical protein
MTLVKMVKCNNEKCLNFSSNHDLSGTWCCDECFIESESGNRPTHDEVLQMKVNYDWDLNQYEIVEIEKYRISKKLYHYCCMICSQSSNRYTKPYTKCESCSSTKIFTDVTI